jgi:hypothetical protein
VFGFDLGNGPVEPGEQGFYVGGFDGGTTPDAQARGRVAVGADVEGDPLFFEKDG